MSSRSFTMPRYRRLRLVAGLLLVSTFVLPASAAFTDEIQRSQDPVAVPESVTTPEDTAIAIEVLANDHDPDGDPLTVASAHSGVPSDPVRATDEAVAAGIYEVTYTWSANVADFNRDGWQDFLLSRHNTSARLYRNDRGTFREVNAGNFPHNGHRHDCAWGDANQDARPDIYCTIGAENGTDIKANELWIQQADSSFVDKAAQYGVADPYGRGRYTTFIDVNHDPYPDLYVGNDYPRQDSFPSLNRLFINEGGTSFRSAAEYGLDKEIGGLCVQAADYNSDGWDDLLVCGDESLKLYRNDGGRGFTDVSAAAGLSEWASSAILIDMNGDGALDLAEIDLWRLGVRLQKGGVFGPAVAMRTLIAGMEISAGDVNGDRRPDLYVVQGGAHVNPDLLLINDGTGTAFSNAVIPQATAGKGDAVSAIDFDRNGTSDFIVLNGHTRIWFDGATNRQLGPVQLIGYQDANGNVKVNADGTVTYTPNRDFAGTDTFTYVVSDGNGGTATATDTVNVTAVNDGVRATSESATTAKNTSVRIEVLKNDTDADGDALRVSAISTAPQHGRASVNADGTVTYTPALDYRGSDSFSYRASDGRGSTATATVYIRVLAPRDCTILGAGGNEFLYGRPGRDVICGAGGNDFVHSHGGNDLIFGNHGNDFLFGGVGSDRMVGGTGTDLCRDDAGVNSFSSCERR